MHVVDATRRATAAGAIAAAQKRKHRGAQDAPAVAPPPSGWWGASTFVWAGCLGSAGQPLCDEHTHPQAGFSEADQVAAFNAVTDAAVTGHRGLGVAGLPRKGAGPAWAGTKTVWGDADADADDQDGARAEPGASEGDGEGGGPPADGPDLSAVKWKRHAARFLRTHADGQAPLSAILQHVMAAAGLANVCRRSAMAALSRRLAKSTKFVVTGDVASLAAETEDA